MGGGGNLRLEQNIWNLPAPPPSHTSLSGPTSSLGKSHKSQVDEQKCHPLQEKKGLIWQKPFVGYLCTVIVIDLLI